MLPLIALVIDGPGPRPDLASLPDIGSLSPNERMWLAVLLAVLLACMAFISGIFYSLSRKGLKEIRHSMDEEEFRALVAGEKVPLKIDERIFSNAPTVTIALQDIGYDRIFSAVFGRVTARSREPKHDA